MPQIEDATANFIVIGVLVIKGTRVVWPQRGQAEIEHFEVGIPSEGEVLVRSRVTLLSPGTERAFFLGLPNAIAQFPYVPGYCCVGEVVQSGPEALDTGQRVVCQTPHSSHSIVSAQEYIPVPAEVPDEEAVFFALIAIALQGVRKARVEIGESVAVIGAGVVGLLAAQLAQQCGGLPVVMVEKDPQRLEFAQHLGADAALPADDNLATAMQEVYGEEGPSVVIEASGHPQAILQAFALARRGGRVVLLGSTRGCTAEVNFYRDVHQKGLSIIGAHNSTRPQYDRAPGWWPLREDERVALQLLKAGRLNVRPLLTHSFPWSEAPRAYELLASCESGAQGILLDWRL